MRECRTVEEIVGSDIKLEWLVAGIPLRGVGSGDFPRRIPGVSARRSWPLGTRRAATWRAAIGCCPVRLGRVVSMNAH
eukprot:8695175-Pyramimonas_sp.AAC.4